MATYIVRKGRIMAKVKIRPFKARTKTFGSHDEAKAWADEQEANLRKLRKSPGKSVDIIANMPATVMPAGEIANLPRIDLASASIGIYFLFLNDVCIYVGQSRRIHMRVNEHRHSKRQRKTFDSYTWINCKAEDLDALERFYIEAMQPLLNTTFTARNAEVAKARYTAGSHKRRPYSNWLILQP